MSTFINLIALVGLLFSTFVLAAPQDHGVDYDIVYVRYPAVDPNDPYVTIPQGESAYAIAKGADLMLLHPDGSEEVLVDCTDCSVMDPFISFDGRYVYYSRIDNIPDSNAHNAGGFIWKIDLQASAPRPQIQLTFDDGFESTQYAGNDASGDFSNRRKLRDMAPFPISGGKVGFTSNRSGLISSVVNTNAEKASVQQIYVIDDHDGSKNTAALSNLHRLEAGSVQMVQHPFQLKDGRILFTTWQSAGTKQYHEYAMSPLFTIDSDGTNLMQFTEPHWFIRRLDHFATQLADESIVWGNYYPSFDYGYGILYRAPIDPDGVDFIRDRIDQQMFSRVGQVNMTPHSTGEDVPAPEITIDGQTVGSGKYSMPSVAPDNEMLVAYSKGYVNHFGAVCAEIAGTRPDRCESLKSGISLVKNAQSVVIDDPTDQSKMVTLHDTPEYNEIWPRAVVSYQSIYGIAQPLVKVPSYVEPEDNRLSKGEVAALLGTSSMLNRDDPNDNQHDFSRNNSRIYDTGNWTIYGADAGVFDDDDIYAVRIIGTPPIVANDPMPQAGNIYGTPTGTAAQVEKYNDTCIKSKFLERVDAKFCSSIRESWEIIGEFPLPHVGQTNANSKKDTSWVAKVPAETPLMIQALDQNGMTVVSELTWRALKPGEKRVDCGGCHVHAKPPLDYSTTSSGQRRPITGIQGVDDSDERISESYIDMTKGAPLLSDAGVYWSSEKVVGVEFRRDLLPIINNRCVACHTDGQSNGGLVLDGANANVDDPWTALVKNGDEAAYKYPQISKYIRAPQARESYLIWNVYGERLDGRTNSDRANDIDFTSHPTIPNLTDLEKRTFARWVDLGNPKDLIETDGFGYTEDNQLPLISINLVRGAGKTGSRIQIGISDAKTNVDWSSLVVRYAEMNNGVVGSFTTIPNAEITVNSDNVATVKKPLLRDYLVEVSVRDTAGNLNTERVVTETLALSANNVGF